MSCVRRHYPQIYLSKTKLNINEKSLKVEKQDFITAQKNIIPASYRGKLIVVKCLSNTIVPLLQDIFSFILNLIHTTCPPEMLVLRNTENLSISKSINCPRILICGLDNSHTNHLAPAILHEFEHLPCHVLDVITLFEETGKAVEEVIIQKVKSAKHTLPSLLYVPDILLWWNLVDQICRNIFISLMKGQNRSVKMLVLITITSDIINIPHEILELFDQRRGEVVEIQYPNSDQRLNYFKQLFFKNNTTLSTTLSQTSFG
ncbi:ATPase family AAA domain-containing protein 2-like [Cotesia typhae]|uniref:ATPase family AAA domain-containing protein 2-like n=1 Tax=Cotesia typhae TaxID=2053667 RepID=UPI003D6876BE